MFAVGELVLGTLVLAVSLVSWLDDRRHVPILVRFGVQSAAAVAWVACFGLNPWSAVAVASLVWMANLYNFMDGADGLAGGMAVFGFGAYGVAAWLGGNASIALVGAAFSAAALGFLCFNFPPARLFMGDVGSVPLGFVAGTLGYEGWLEGLWPWWFPLLVFSPFAVDATTTLLRRGFRGERVWQAHRDHYYQRLVRMGWSHRKTALAEFGLMLLAASSALILMWMPPVVQALGLAGWLALYALLAWRIDLAWKLVACR